MSPWGMVSQTRLDYGSGGYQAPAILHFPRSAKGKRSARKKVEDNPMCAFDLLATVAGKLLLERENSLNRRHNSRTSIPVATTNAIKPEQVDEEKPFEAYDRLSCNDDLLGPEYVLKKSIKNTFGELTREISLEPPSVLAKSEISNAGTIDVELNGGRKENFDSFAGNYALGRPCSSSVDSHGSKDESKTLYQSERRIIGGALDENAPCIYSSDDGMDLDAKPPVLVSSDSSVEVPPCRNNNISYNISFPKREGLTDLSIDKDDDESSSRCTHPTIVTNKASRLQRIGDRRIRKLLASKFWKLAPTRLQDEKKPALQCKRPCYTRQRTQRSSFKKRKLFDHCSIPVFDRRTYSEDMPRSCEKGGVKLERNDSHATLCDETGTSTSTAGQEFYGSPDYQVKLSIKSFKVPELVIEIPETSTVGSLKRTVMEAVTAILGDGLRVGVLIHGKKVRNDKKTLRQVGISHGDKLDNLGFTLEPISRQGPAPPTSSSDPDFLSLGCAPEPLARIPPIAPAVVGQGLSDAIPQPFSTFPGSDRDSVRPPTDTVLPKKTAANSLALVAVCPLNVEALAMNVEALTMVPLRNKPKRTEVAQRRVRRPFSVTEVEALVQAVEKLGTGRWRDVKLCAFENAKHRTYVDLKDKWKTLVHTAQISPQQRRGEPVPQDLLDRVLTAHAYWTQQQVKLQLKPPPALPPPPAEQPELRQLL